jgi:hypothetical protein
MEDATEGAISLEDGVDESGFFTMKLTKTNYAQH